MFSFLLALGFALGVIAIAVLLVVALVSLPWPLLLLIVVVVLVVSQQMLKLTQVEGEPVTDELLSFEPPRKLERSPKKVTAETIPVKSEPVAPPAAPSAPRLLYRGAPYPASIPDSSSAEKDHSMGKYRGAAYDPVPAANQPSEMTWGKYRGAIWKSPRSQTQNVTTSEVNPPIESDNEGTRKMISPEDSLS